MPARKPRPVTLRRVEHPFEVPAKTGMGQVHVIEELAEKSVGNVRHFRNQNEHPLMLAYKRAQISREQYDAGHLFFVLFNRMGASGTDSTQALMTSRASGGSRTPYSQTQAEAIQSIQRVEKSMGAINYRICRKFCGEAWPMSDAINAVTSCHPSGMKHRMQEALTDLRQALDRVHVHIDGDDRLTV